jgi:hypothetical protein
MTDNRVDVKATEEVLESLRRQFPGRISLDRTETAKALGFKNPITIDRLRARGLLRASLATRKPMYSLTEIARFLVETSEGR